MAVSKKPKDEEENEENEEQEDTPDYEGLLSSIVSSAVEDALEKFTKKNGPAPRRTDVQKPHWIDALFGQQR
jgi:hypothetical protein